MPDMCSKRAKRIKQSSGVTSADVRDVAMQFTQTIAHMPDPVVRLIGGAPIPLRAHF